MEANNRFSLGASSHMANIAFDKHVAFCEAYVAEMQATLSALYREGPHRDALEQAAALHSIQEKYRVWLTPEIEKDLEPFEKALREIGAGSGYVEAVRESGNRDDGALRAETIKLIYQKFAEVVGLPQWNGQQVTTELTTRAIIEKLRAVLGISELTALRRIIVANAAQ